MLHREDGPAIESTDGTFSWFKNGKRHREDGPAARDEHGGYFWFIDGKQYSFKMWLSIVSLTDEQKTELLLSGYY